MTLKRILSGMQPTGELHLGNYLGALANWVELQQQFDCLFCIVDQHAITVEYEPREMPAKVFDMAVSYLAAGIDPNRAAIFVQSHVPEHTELAWYLAAVTQYGELGRMTQFKDKSATHHDNVNTALFTYPVLMAADILLYRATHVPVGDDQTQHLELTRDVAHRFNTRYKREFFTLPRGLYSNTPRIMGLDGLRKMSKSLGNHISMLEEPKPLSNKLRTAYTDPQRTVAEEPGRPELCNIYRMHTAVTEPSLHSEFARKCASAAPVPAKREGQFRPFGCGDCKLALETSLNTRLSPIRERAKALRAHPEQVYQVLADGAQKARKIAAETMTEVRELMGLRTAGASQ
jgi:tryptophanyl-tRNA synthetase